jgi:hypothetical protein
LVQKQQAVPSDVKNLYERHRTKGTWPSFDEVVQALHSTAKLYSRMFIMIDALDEYHVSNNEGQNRFLSELFSLQNQAELNLFATSRFISEVTSRFEGCIWKEIQAQDDDVLRYVNTQIPQLLQSQISKYPEVQGKIRSDIVKAAEGMYVHSLINV